MNSNSTFKCWLIANFEIVLFWTVTIIGGLFLLLFARDRIVLSNEISEENGLFMLVLIGAMVLAGTMPTSNNAFQYTKVLSYIALPIFLTWLLLDVKEDGESFVSVIIAIVWIIFIIASAIGGWLAVFTYRNMDQVVSRRMLFRNSKVSLFEFAWRYSLDRFASISGSIIFCAVWLALLIFESLGSGLFLYGGVNYVPLPYSNY